jgi:hypothetical protein
MIKKKIEIYSELFVESFDNNFNKVVLTDENFINGCPSKMPYNITYYTEHFTGLPYTDSNLFEGKAKEDGFELSKKLIKEHSTGGLIRKIHINNKDINKEKSVTKIAEKSKIKFVFTEYMGPDGVYTIHVSYGYDYQNTM